MRAPHRPGRPYNLIFTTNGIACTSATVIAATLGVRDLDAIDGHGAAAIARVHLLLAMFNALQPGVFALSGWDLTGMLTLPPEQVGELLEHGDTRWSTAPRMAAYIQLGNLIHYLKAGRVRRRHETLAQQLQYHNVWRKFGN